jgi:PhnB protein
MTANDNAPSGILGGMSQSPNPVPPGFHTITPHLNVNGAAKFIEFLEEAFGATEINRAPGPGGKLMHALVKIGDSVLMLADDFGEEMHLPPMAQGRLPLVLSLYVPDADAAWAQAVAAGCEVVFPIGDQFWGDRYGQVKDPFGHVWAIATHKEDLTPQELQERQAKMFHGSPS